MPTGLEPSDLLLIAAAIAVPAAVLAVVLSARSHRRTALRERFGAEYDRTVADAPSRRAALADLEERERLAQDLALHDAAPEVVGDLGRRLAALQYRFVEDPAATLLDLRDVADEALAARDYPVHEERDTALRLLSVEDPDAAVALRRLDRVTAERPPYARDDPPTLEVQREVFLAVRGALRTVAGVTLPTPPTSAGDLEPGP